MKGKCGVCGREGLPNWTATYTGRFNEEDIYKLVVRCPACMAYGEMLASPCTPEIACAMYSAVKLPGHVG